MSLFRFLLRGSWLTIAMSVLIGIIGGAAGIGLIHLVRKAMHGRAADPSTIYYFIGLGLVVLFARAISQLIMARFSGKTASRLVEHLCQQILQAPLRKLEDVGIPQLQKIMTKDIKLISSAMDAIPDLCVKSTIIACGLVYLCWLSPGLFGSIALVGAVSGVIVLLLSRRSRRSARRAREHQNALQRQIHQMIDGVKELKLHKPRQDAFLKDGIGAANASLRKRQSASQKFKAFASTVGRSLGFVAIALLLFVWPPVDTGTLFIFGFLMMFMMRQSGSVGTGFFLLFGKARMAARRLERLGITVKNLEPIAPVEPLKTNWERLELVGAAFTYKSEDAVAADDELDDDSPDAEPFANGLDATTTEATAAQNAKEESAFTLGPIDLLIRPGEITFVVGGNGSGKSTLLKVLTGLYPLDSGEIRVDGQMLDPQRHDAYRQYFTCLFDDTVVFENLYGIDLIQIDERARQYLEALHLDREVKIADGKFSIAGTLSKGQRKRLALVSAHLEDRSIYVFDEWAANQDPLFKRVFYKTILPDLKARNRTVIAVTHDDNYFDCADRILVLRDGKAIEGDWKDNLFQPHRATEPAAPLAVSEGSSIATSAT